MSRQHLTFSCEGSILAATVDEAAGETGVLIVTGGNETRAGAFSGQSRLAARIAAAGYPVFRFDRRGTGDSAGKNGGFRESEPDIREAIGVFREIMPGLKQVVGFGNCDAASALMLMAGEGLDGLILANPWTIENESAAPPPEFVRARYAEKIRNPRELLRLLTGKVSLRGLASGLLQAMRPAPAPSSLVQDMAAGLQQFGGKATILLAGRDRTAQAFDACWNSQDPRIQRCDGASHAFVEPDAQEWLYQRIVSVLAGEQAR